MHSTQNIAINRESLTIRVMTNQIEIKQLDKLICTIKGITVFPEHVKIEPLEVKRHLLRKTETVEKEFGIENELYKGNYFANIVDYSLGEITYAANFLTDIWSEDIWKLLNSDPDKLKFTVTLKPPAIKNQLLKANPDLFSTIEDIDNFCAKYNLNIQKFAVPAYFSQLEIDLNGVSARLSREIIFFRRKMFTELLINKIDSKIYSINKNSEDKLHDKCLLIYRKWKSKELDGLKLVQKYIKSPFIFDDTEQFDKYLDSTVAKSDKFIHEDLISECLFWIQDFSKVKKRFERAVNLYKDGTDFRDCIDNMRLALEILLKELLNNNKSLENQIAEIGKYQELHGIGKEIRNMFQKILDYYIKFQNNNVKHDDNINNLHEVEFVFSLSMIFIRVLIKSNNKLAVTRGHKTLRG